MNTRLFACLILLASAVRGEEPGWRWYPVNSEEVHDGKVIAAYSGLIFYFTSPPSARASVTARVVDCGKERTVSGEIDTDGTHGETFLRFPIGSLDGFRVAQLTVTFDGRGITVSNAQAGELYPYR